MWSNSIAQVCFIYLLCTLMTSANKSLEKKNFPSGWKCYKTIGSYISCTFIKIRSTWEVWRALKKLELLLATPQATLMHLSCSPNFPPASYLDETYEPIVNYVVKWNTKSPEATIQLFKRNLKCRSLNQRKMKMTCKITVKDGDHVWMLITKIF